MRWLWTIIFVAIISSCISDEGYADLKEGDRIPSFTVCSDEGCFSYPEDINEGKAVLIFIDPMCKDCRAFVPTLNSCSGIIVVSRREDAEAVKEFRESTNLVHPVYYQGGEKAYHSMFQSVVPRVVFIQTGRAVRIYADPSLPDSDTINSFLTGY